ncbi:hypothetical protein D3C84_727650 [compost metagenome]
MLGADRFEGAGHGGIVEFLPGLRVDLQQVGLDHGRAQVVGQQLANLAGLGHIGADLCQSGSIGDEARGHHHIAGEAGLGHLDVAYVGSEQRAHPAAIDPGGEEHFLGDLAQGVEELWIVQVSLALPVQADENTVGPGKAVPVLTEGGHIGMTERD